MCLALPISRLFWDSMQNRKFTKVVIWIVVIGMVLSMGVFAVSLVT